MNKLLADLNVMDVKLHNYHYNLIGSDFLTIHVALEDEYELFHDWIDEVAERMKQLGEYPVGSLKDCLEISTIKEVPSKDYKTPEIIKDVVSDYETLVSDLKKLKETHDDITNNLFEDIETELEKKIWFLGNIIK